MNIDTSKETGYAVQSTVATDELIVTKETCYVVLKLITPDTIGRLEFSGEIRVKGIIVIP